MKRFLFYLSMLLNLGVRQILLKKLELLEKKQLESLLADELLLLIMIGTKLINDIDYEDIYDNIDDYEYPYNHVNRCDLQV